MTRARDHIWGPTAAATALLRGSEVTPLDWLCSIAKARGTVVVADAGGMQIGTRHAPDAGSLVAALIGPRVGVYPRPRS